MNYYYDRFTRHPRTDPPVSKEDQSTENSAAAKEEKN